MDRRELLKKVVWIAPVLFPLGALAKKKPHPHGSDFVPPGQWN